MGKVTETSGPGNIKMVRISADRVPRTRGGVFEKRIVSGHEFTRAVSARETQGFSPPNSIVASLVSGHDHGRADQACL